jgi:hypothetical protein
MLEIEPSSLFDMHEGPRKWINLNLILKMKGARILSEPWQQWALYAC